MATQETRKDTHWSRPAALTAFLLGTTLTASADADTRIRGGEPAVVGEFPFIIELQVFVEKDQRWLTSCTASLADPRAILTAAHCIPGVIPGSDPQIPVRLIFNRVSDDDAIQDVVTESQIERIIWNPEFGAFPHRDLAVIVLKTPNTTTPPVTLPEPHGRPALGASITAAGWGTTNNAADPRWLRKVDIPVVPCVPVSDYLCAGVSGIGVGKGDSGGPGFVRHPDGTFIQYGVVSGISLSPDMISGYTDLSSPDVWRAISEDLKATGLEHLVRR